MSSVPIIAVMCNSSALTLRPSSWKHLWKKKWQAVQGWAAAANKAAARKCSSTKATRFEACLECKPCHGISSVAHTNESLMSALHKILKATPHPVSHTVANVDMPAATAGGSSTTAALKKAAPKMPTIAPMNGK